MDGERDRRAQALSLAPQVTILRLTRWYNAFTRSKLAKGLKLTEYRESSIDSIIS